jgi:hypothetical protein
MSFLHVVHDANQCLVKWRGVDSVIIIPVTSNDGELLSVNEETDYCISFS